MEEKLVKKRIKPKLFHNVSEDNIFKEEQNINSVNISLQIQMEFNKKSIVFQNNSDLGSVNESDFGSYNEPFNGSQNQPLNDIQEKPLNDTQNKPLNDTQNKPINNNQNKPLSKSPVLSYVNTYDNIMGAQNFQSVYLINNPDSEEPLNNDKLNDLKFIYLTGNNSENTNGSTGDEQKLQVGQVDSHEENKEEPSTKKSDANHQIKLNSEAKNSIIDDNQPDKEMNLLGRKINFITIKNYRSDDGRTFLIRLFFHSLYNGVMKIIKVYGPTDGINTFIMNLIKANYTINNIRDFFVEANPDNDAIFNSQPLDNKSNNILDTKIEEYLDYYLYKKENTLFDGFTNLEKDLQENKKENKDNQNLKIIISELKQYLLSKMKKNDESEANMNKVEHPKKKGNKKRTKGISKADKTYALQSKEKKKKK